MPLKQRQDPYDFPINILQPFGCSQGGVKSSYGGKVRFEVNLMGAFFAKDWECSIVLFFDETCQR